jgi:hypothetical protein
VTISHLSPIPCKNPYVPFKSYRFEHPKTERSITFRRISYLWAGLFGAFYVARVGYGSVLKALAINIAFAIGLLGLTFITTIRTVTPVVQFVVLVIAVPVVIAIQGQLMIQLIWTGFRRRGWMVRKAD